MRFSPDVSVAEAGLSLANKIAMREPGLERIFGEEALFWKPSTSGIFVEPISMPRVGFTSLRSAYEAEFQIGGEDSMSMTVHSKQNVPLEDDPLAHEVLELFSEIYEAHTHALCFRAMRLERLRRNEIRERAAQERERRMEGNLQAMYAQGHIRKTA